MINNKKDILSFIRKYSQEKAPNVNEVDPSSVPDAETDSMVPSTSQNTSEKPTFNLPEVPIGGKPNVVNMENTEIDVNKPRPQTNTSNINIKQMQEAIQKFVDVVLSKKDNAAKHFNNYITEKYVANSTSVGEEWTDDPKRVDINKKQPTSPVDRNITLDTVRRLGAAKSEAKPDGVWGPRTNNAILDVYAFAYALYNLYTKLGEKDNFGFEQSDLKTFDDNLIKSEEELKKISIIEKQKKAKLITPVIKKLINFYNLFSQKVLQSPIYSEYIKGEKSLFRVIPTVDPVGKITESDLNKANNISIGPLVLTDSKNKKITIGAIPLKLFTDKQVLINLAKSPLGYTDNQIQTDPSILKRILSELIQHVKGVLTASKASVPQQIATNPVPQTATNK